MPLAHVCPVCGNQLARVRAEFATYSLPIIRCDCGYACVRRKHPCIVRWRQFQRVSTALLFAAAKLVLTFVLAFLVIGMTSSIQRDLSDYKLSVLGFSNTLIRGQLSQSRRIESWFLGERGMLFFILLFAVSAASGVWLRTQFNHRPRHHALLGWIALTGFMITIEAWIWPIRCLIHTLTGHRVPGINWSRQDAVDISLLLGASWLTTLTTYPLGRVLVSLNDWMRRRLFIRCLRKTRKRRRGE